MTMEGYEEEDLLNSSLTNLQWLQHINMNLSEGLGVPRRTVASSSSSGSPTSPAKEERQVSTQRAGRAGAVDFTRNSHIKPPYSYATLICMAIRETAKHKITLSAIYNWIMANFAYYRNADPSWQNSIRHNLSLNKCFVKVPRDKDEPGKGGFWTINADYEEYFKNGVFKRRKAKKKTSNPPKAQQQQSKPTSGGVYRTMNVYHSGKPRSNNGIIRLPSSFTLNPQQEEKTRPCNLKLNINRTCQRSSPYSRPPNTTNTTNNNNNNHNDNNNNTNGLNLNSSSRCSALNLNCSLNKSGLLNTSTVDEQPPAWDLVLKDIQLNSASSQATEVMKRTEDDFFKTGPSLNFESLHEDLTSPELNELVRDIESLIDGPVLREPELMIKGEKVSSNSVLSSDPYNCGSSTSWSNIMEELNLGGGIGDFLDSPLNALV